MVENFLPVNRNIQKHWIYRDAQYFHVWMDMLFRARFSADPVAELIEGQQVQINYGEFVFGRQAWSERLGIGEQRLRTLIAKLVDDDMIELVKRYNKFSIYRLKNYAKFNHLSMPEEGKSQPAEQPAEQRQTNQQSNQQTNRQKSLTHQGFDGHANRQSNQQKNGELTGRLTGRLTTKEYRLNNTENIDKEIKDLNTSPRNKKPAYSEDSGYYQMALYFHQRVMEQAALNNKAHLVKNANLQAWSDDFRKMIELDKRDTQELKRVIDWCTADPFWQKNILSAATLRKQYTQLAMKMDSKPANHSRSARQQRDDAQMDILRQLYEEGEQENE
ncbi:hypothetical protein [Cohnella fermenti]|uniref:Uncharacterized protein n=1 Tax=Cohnella fermenti TaxID=2565925 RepID=A0A4S4C8L9_9BACL|nr:hypothetical protein [Cohnella fermenti]THF83715.1 hypothetical protein E6C55_03220 [Cohnella fermenti]